MLTCPACSAALDPGSGACPRCRIVVAVADRLAGHGDTDSTTLVSSGAGRRVASSIGGPSSGIDHGRFPPGTVLGGRYRIIARLGRGGMGEVYRADDLKLEQAVALKFLPADVDRDPARLTQLHTEVRLARQVSHPNVCRVYDVGEADGHTFISMEYVDGEDLASLLRRIGRFPQDRAVEIARQVCAGLGAAHERGVVHRDLKPANVMVDGGGKVRVTDFGLAGVSGQTIHAGTPAYMAPEQLAGGQVTARSDIYSLGLVLYEVFTGQRALEGNNLAELIRKREQPGIVAPTTIVPDLDPAIERAILRCLRPDPESRPPSSLWVAALLPGGDPIAAALAAGQTPSPEMVAAAGAAEGISARRALLAAMSIAAMLVAVLLIYQRVLFVNRVATPKSPEALADRAQEAVVRLGYTSQPRGAASGLSVSTDYLVYIAASSSSPDRWKAIAPGRPETLIFWYRTSPLELVPWGKDNNIEALNPPLTVSGMVLAVLDPAGRLSEFHAVPEPVESSEPHARTNWHTLFELAGLDESTFSSVEPRWVPLVYADERAAWEGPVPERPDLKLRLEAAGYHGRVVFYATTGPWTRSARSMPRLNSRFSRAVVWLSVLTSPALMIVSALLARRNLRLGRGDRLGAMRAAAVVFSISLAARLLGASYVADPDPGMEIQRVFLAIGASLFDAALLWLAYVGLEPYVRRSSPSSLIGWTRLMGGNWNDPHVGADVLLGVGAGLLMTLVYTLYYLLPPLVGLPATAPVPSEFRTLLGSRFVLSHIFQQTASAITTAMLATVGLTAALILLKRRSLAMLAIAAAFTPVVMAPLVLGYPLFSILVAASIAAVGVFAIVHSGLLAGIVAVATYIILFGAPLTTDFSKWWAGIGLWYLGTIALVGFGACQIARRSRVVTGMGGVVERHLR